jgi:molybdenum cofactor synthesis domain-containing protein
MTPITVAILTVSDRSSRGERVDSSGPALERVCREKLGATILAMGLVPDERDQIKAELTRWARAGVGMEDGSRKAPDLILTTGGTGLAPRDVTPEATAAVLERRHPALLELVRLRCLAITPKTFLSRGESGTIGQSLVINLPGSPKGAVECLSALLDILPHAIETLRGDVKDG